MHPFRRHAFVLAAIPAVLTFAMCLPAGAAQQTTITKFVGSATTGGTWTRTITDVSEPNEPGGGKVLATYNVVVNYSSGWTDVQIANAYRNACNSTLPAPANNPNGYNAVFEQGNNRKVRLSKQAGTYNYSDAGLPTGPAPRNGGGSTLAGISIVTDPPLNAEDAPVASAAALASLVAGLTVLGWWGRRRRSLA